MYKMNDDTGHEYTDGYNDGYDDCKKEREAELAALRLDAERLRKFTIELTDTFRRAMTGREIDKDYSRKLLKEAEELTQKEEGK